MGDDIGTGFIHSKLHIVQDLIRKAGFAATLIFDECTKVLE
jgi:hypothetical protein